MIARITAMLLVIAALCGCNPSAQVTATPTPNPRPTSSALSLKITGRGTSQQPVRFVEQANGNRVQYDLLASSFESIGGQGNARSSFKDVRVTFHGKDGSTLMATAPQAIVDQVTNTIQMLGGVRARNNLGTTLSCDSLTYDHLTEMLYGTGHVAFTSATGFRATGNRFESDISLTHTRMQ
ncbi:MAG TPA: LPS export ABC transporter periplasmic protein LptC [Candidatus Acidoferrum sp.]|jgi:LPS export ABC transporter protein LptC|nr:LPS export ABC transporter periplasmic protein LptC [Candidatus Acidoferrum sp.]